VSERVSIYPYQAQESSKQFGQCQQSFSTTLLTHKHAHHISIRVCITCQEGQMYG
jgi:hypothetical protein